MRKFAIRSILILFVFTFVGCATLPKPEEMRAEVQGFELPMLPSDGKAVVYVVRPSSLGALIRFNVFVDNKEPEYEMGFTRGAQYIYFNLPPGEHQVLSKAENWGEINVTVEAGDIVFIQQIPTMGIIMARNHLVPLPDYEGKYRVKHLRLGTIIKTDF